MIAAGLIDVLGKGVMRAITGTSAHIYRTTVTTDGRGGQTQTWRKVATLPVRLRNIKDNETMVGDALQSVSSWVMVCDRTANIAVNDRVRVDEMPGLYFEVMGNNIGQSDLVCQSVDLVQYSDGEWL
jgi:head-tail adaptor